MTRNGVGCDGIGCEWCTIIHAVAWGIEIGCGNDAHVEGKSMLGWGLVCELVMRVLLLAVIGVVGMGLGWVV